MDLTACGTYPVWEKMQECTLLRLADDVHAASPKVAVAMQFLQSVGEIAASGTGRMSPLATHEVWVGPMQRDARA